MNNSLRRLWAGILTSITGLLCCTTLTHAQVKFYNPLEEAVAKGIKLEQVDPAKAPKLGTFWSLQRSGGKTAMPPLPYNPFPDLPVYYLGHGNAYLVDDSSVDYAAIYQQREEERQLRKLALDFGLLGMAEYYELEGGGEPMALYSYLSSDLWIEILAMTNSTSYLTLHGTRQDYLYQLLSKETLLDKRWKFGEIVSNPDLTNQIYFSPVSTGGKPTTFYRGVEGNQIVMLLNQEGVSRGAEPTNSTAPPEVRKLTVLTQQAQSAPLTVWYELSGSAVNGVDYTNLSGSVTIPQGQTEGYFYIHPTYDTLVEFEETVTARLVITNGYLVAPDYAASTVFIADNLPTNLFTTVVTGLTQAVGIDYHPPTQSLLVSQHFFEVDDWSFLRVNTNGVVTNWSTIKGLNEEKKICVVQATTNGFTAGEMYFGTPVNGVIGKVSADGTQTNLSWAVLTTNNLAANSLIRGSLYIDRTGIFGHDLIAVTGGSSFEGGEVWRVNASGSATLLANITNSSFPHLEGVITLTNDVQKWGPWAGKIITGAEAKTPPLIHTVATNGVVADFDLGIAPEDFDIIPPNQDLYLTSYNEGRVLKLSRTLLTNYVGDMLITQEATKLFIVKWNSMEGEFEVRSISVGTDCGEPLGLEHATFAPINLPSISCQ